MEILHWFEVQRKLLVLVAGLFLLLPMLREPAFSRRQMVVCPPNPVVFLWLIGVCLSIALTPAETLAGDKWIYKENFENIAIGRLSWLDIAKDKIFYLYTSIVATFTQSHVVYFVITAALYIAGYAITFGRIAREHWSVLMLAAVYCIGFSSYGDNTLRAGLAFSVLFCGISCFPRKIPFLILAALSFGIHASMIIPITACCIAFFYKNTRIIFIGWVFLLLISIFAENSTQEFLANIFSEAEDQRMVSYALGESNGGYKQGFRIDFLLYGFVPILFGLYYVFRKQFTEPFYVWMLNVYIITNGFWLLMIRAIFTDRFAYLSWALIPIILFYPLLKKRIWANQNFCVAGGIFGLFCLDLILGFRGVFSAAF